MGLDEWMSFQRFASFYYYYRDRGRMCQARRAGGRFLSVRMPPPLCSASLMVSIPALFVSPN
jgi:hypothetical protein